MFRKPMTDLMILILAGGEGRRIGGEKPFCRLADRTLLDRTVQYARTFSDFVAISVRDGPPTGKLPRIVDDPAIEGPLGGLAAGLRFAEAEGYEFLLTMPCDMPFLPDDLLVRLKERIGGATVAVASSRGHLHPVCALWRSTATRALDSYLSSGRRSLKGLAEAAGCISVEWSDEPDRFFNINTEADLAEAERLLAS